MTSSPTTDWAGRVAALPGMDRLLPALDGLPPTHLVGGAVRDLIVGHDSVDLDLTVEGDGVAVARELARRLGGEASEHERFGTATVRAGDLAVDLATARRESYAHPGALPEVEPASLEEDLARRDFSVNAMAVGLSEPGRGELSDPLARQRVEDASPVAPGGEQPGAGHRPQVVRGVGHALADLPRQLLHRSLALGEHVGDLGSTAARQRLGHLGEAVEERILGLSVTHGDILRRSRLH